MEIVYNAAVTLANIAMYDGNHSLLINSEAVESLKKLVPRDSRFDGKFLFDFTSN